MMRREDFEPGRKADYRPPEAPDYDEDHGLPVGALVITLGYLTILTLLWIQIYVDLLNRGNIPQS